MPTYSYQCRGCNHAEDFTRKIENRDNPGYCTKCEAWSSRRTVTAPGLIGETVTRDQRVIEPQQCGCLWMKDSGV